MTTFIPVPAGLPLDTASWERTPLVVRQLVIHPLTVIEQQAEGLAVFEAHVSQPSNNSDRPHSSDPPYAKRTAHAGTQGHPGARPGHPGHRLTLLAPTEVVAVTPEACPYGRWEFPETLPYSTHQVIEQPQIADAGGARGLASGPLSSVWQRHQSVSAGGAPLCVGCGPRLTALIGELSAPQRPSRSTAQAFCTSVLGVSVSRGAIALHDEAVAEKARGAQVHYSDETAWYQHGVLAWLWVMVNTAVALFKVQTRRNKRAIEMLVERWAGILVSEGYGVYRQWVYGRQTCLAHLIRQARGLSARHDPKISQFGQRVLAELQPSVHWAQAPPTAGTAQTWYARMVHLPCHYRLHQDEAATLPRTVERGMAHL